MIKFYICDRKRCVNCSAECEHTSNESHAACKEMDKWEVTGGALFQSVHGTSEAACILRTIEEG